MDQQSHQRNTNTDQESTYRRAQTLVKTQKITNVLTNLPRDQHTAYGKTKTPASQTDNTQFSGPHTNQNKLYTLHQQRQTPSPTNHKQTQLTQKHY